MLIHHRTGIKSCASHRDQLWCLSFEAANFCLCEVFTHLVCGAAPCEIQSLACYQHALWWRMSQDLFPASSFQWLLPLRHVSCSVVDALKVSCSTAQHATEEQQSGKNTYLRWTHRQLDTVDNGRHYELRASNILCLHFIIPRTVLKQQSYIQDLIMCVCSCSLSCSSDTRNEKRHVPVITAQLGFDEGLCPKLLHCKSI